MASGSCAANNISMHSRKNFVHHLISEISDLASHVCIFPILKLSMSTKDTTAPTKHANKILWFGSSPSVDGTNSKFILQSQGLGEAKPTDRSELMRLEGSAGKRMPRASSCWLAASAWEKARMSRTGELAISWYDVCSLLAPRRVLLPNESF
jgi:hypothetical protein